MTKKPSVYLDLIEKKFLISFFCSTFAVQNTRKDMAKKDKAQKTKKVAASKAENKEKQSSYLKVLGFKNLFNEKTNFTAGFILLALAILFIISFTSFLSTAALDQSLILNPIAGDIKNPDRDFANCCGSLGAYVSFFFVSFCFGLPSYIIPAFLIFVALKMMGVYQVNLWKWFFGTMIAMIWCSVAFAKFVNPFMLDCVFNAGGQHGEFVCNYLENLVGTPGLTAVLIVVAVIFLVFVTNETILIIRKILNPTFLRRIEFTINRPSDKNDAPAEDSNIEEQMASGSFSVNEPQENLSSTIDLTQMEDIKEMPTPTAGTEAAKDGADLELNIIQNEDEQEAKGNTVISAEDVFKTPINPREPFTNYKFPTLDLLKKYDDNHDYTTKEELLANKNRITEVLHSFGVEIKAITATVGPTITLYEITPAEGVRISKIRNLEDDIALSLSALGIRIIAPIPGKGTIGIEVPNANPRMVSMESVLNSRKFQETKMELPLVLGKTITNEVFMVDLAKIPHLLVAGATGQGKSVGLNAMISSLLYKKHPNELKIVLVDPKKVEFSVYGPIADHFMAQVEDTDDPIITDVTKVVHTLKSLCTLMDHRYDMLKLAGARNIKEYNEKFVNHKLNLTQGHEYMPYIVVIIDEFGDLIMTAGKEVELPIARIAQLARAVGIHMIIATQRPTTTIITGNIKANFPGRVSFRVGAVVDSRTILDRAGANQLVGKGDMLYLNGNEPVRVQCAYLDTPEVERLTDYIENQPGPVAPLILPEPLSEDGGAGGENAGTDVSSWDPLFEQAAVLIVNSQQGSTSMIQRHFSIGYNRAGRLMDQMEKAGIVGAAHGSKPREVLFADENAVLNHIASLRGGAIG